jgi:hypothetical protein
VKPFPAPTGIDKPTDHSFEYPNQIVWLSRHSTTGFTIWPTRLIVVVVLVDVVVVVGGVYVAEALCNVAVPDMLTVEMTMGVVATSFAEPSILRFAPDASTPPVRLSVAVPESVTDVAKPRSARIG